MRWLVQGEEGANAQRSPTHAKSMVADCEVHGATLQAAP